MKKWVLVIAFTYSVNGDGVAITTLPDAFVSWDECYAAGQKAEKEIEGVYTDIRFTCLEQTQR